MSMENPGPRKEAKKISAGGVKKMRNVGAKIVTANDLFSGVPVYLTTDGGWTEDIAAAAVAEGEDALGLLERATADEAHAVGPYLMDVEAEDGHTEPSGRAELRETIRYRGPTIHPHLARHPG